MKGKLFKGLKKVLWGFLGIILGIFAATIPVAISFDAFENYLDRDEISALDKMKIEQSIMKIVYDYDLEITADFEVDSLEEVYQKIANISPEYYYVEGFTTELKNISNSINSYEFNNGIYSILGPILSVIFSLIFIICDFSAVYVWFILGKTELINTILFLHKNKNKILIRENTNNEDNRNETFEFLIRFIDVSSDKEVNKATFSLDKLYRSYDSNELTKELKTIIDLVDSDNGKNRIRIDLIRSKK